MRKFSVNFVISSTSKTCSIVCPSREVNDDGSPLKLGPKTTNKGAFYETVKELLASSLEPTCCLDIWELDCLTIEGEETTPFVTY